MWLVHPSLSGGTADVTLVAKHWDLVATFGVAAYVMLLKIWKYHLQKVFQVLRAVRVVGVLQEAVVVSKHHVSHVDFLPFGEGLHQPGQLFGSNSVPAEVARKSWWSRSARLACLALGEGGVRLRCCTL